MPENEIDMPSASAQSATRGPALKQWMRPGNAPFPASSSRIAAVSSSASRVWTMSGSPVSRAAAAWARKFAACAARGLCS